METFSTQRFDAKIEGFESCIIDGTGQQQDITQTVSTETTVQDVGTMESEENSEAAAMQQVQNVQQNNQISPLMHQNPQHNVTLTPVRLPAILDGEFFSVMRLEDSNVTARCLQCHKLLNGNLKSTGNFLSHVKRVHPFLMEKIKSKSNQRRPAAIYIDLSQEKCSEIIRVKNRLKKFPKTVIEECHQPIAEETFEQTEWIEPAGLKKRKSEEIDTSEMLRVSHNNSIIVEDEFDAIGRNVAAKLRHMRLDQRIIAEKLLNDILFEAQLGNLHRDSNIHV
ncbi:uncharacterized protein LOC100679061 isoform X1 [Nasonia vitripennis]|uniref:Protein stand still n=1 Tax=Nasonia vitripennis TaxID=7425 RepID=A0A7M7IQD3_NASVI|nr:uncharacterized protein LOC100679061 isoform X1 [Nasonia vitripennis]XP_016840525.1 uncharacterized protein LOC100679061 isoform X1 [Nasonia vitripennis]